MEVNIIKGLSHPNIVELNGVLESDDYFYLCFQYLACNTLAFNIRHFRKKLNFKEVS